MKKSEEHEGLTIRDFLTRAGIAWAGLLLMPNMGKAILGNGNLMAYSGRILLKNGLIQVVVQGVQYLEAFGNNPLILQMARDKKLASLEEIVCKMTGAVAERYHVKDRVLIKQTLTRYS